MIVLPNLANNTLELCRLRDDDEPGPLPLHTACVLQLPCIAQSSVLFRMRCRSEPNPMGPTTQSPPHGDGHFRSKAADAIVMFSMDIHDRDGLTHSFILIVHRSALLAQLHLHASVPQSPMLEPPPVIPWDTWGPPVCRWFDARDIATRWITTTCGQRYAVVMRGIPASISVCDFNQTSIRRHAQDASAGKLSGADICPRLAVDHLWSPAFQNPVLSCLPYIVTTTAQKYEYESALIDEDKVIGLKVWICSCPQLCYV